MRFAGLLMLAAAAAAQGPEPLPPPDGPKQPVSGRVIDAESRQPVRGAKVSVMSGASELASAYSGPDGRFQIDAAPVGEHRIAVLKSRYSESYQRVVVPAAQPLSDLTLEQHRYAALAGRVVDHRGHPVTGARVLALFPHFEDGETFLRPASVRTPMGFQTDDRGFYRVWGLRPGVYRVGVFPAGAPAAAGVLRFESAGGFYPNASSLAEAEAIRLGWGEVREGVDLRLGPAAPTRAAVQIATPGAAEGPCESCVVSIMLNEQGASVTMGYVESGPGNLTIVEGLPPGRYLAALRAFDRSAGSGLFGNAELFVTESPADPILLEALGEVPLRGRIVLEDRPEERKDVPLRGGLRAMPPRSALELGMITRNSFAQLEISAAESPFELGCIPGEIELQLMAEPDVYVAGIRLDGKPLESSTISVPPGGVAGDLVVRLRFDSGKVEGSLEGVRQGPGGASAEYAIYARPVGGGFLRGRYLRVLPNGTFSQPLPPGTYDLIAFAAGAGYSPLSDPAQEAAIRKLSRRVTVKAGETTTAKVPVIPQP